MITLYTISHNEGKEGKSHTIEVPIQMFTMFICYNVIIYCLIGSGNEDKVDFATTINLGFHLHFIVNIINKIL